ncbi:MAG TPA: FHA domain-containing protein [Solirubrobacteraceae bacterium]
MAESPASPALQTPAELKAVIETERAGAPFVVYRDGDGAQQILVLGPARERVNVGRSLANDICLDWDTEVSRLHAELERVGDDWTVGDDGLSRNGTHLNGERLAGRRRLRDGDVIRFGQTVATFRQPAAITVTETEVAADIPDRASLSPAQRRVLIALCRPFKDASGYVAPATNQQIADELFLSVEAVKTHLRTLFAKFGIEDLPQNQKRIRLVELALRSGAITPREL